MDQTQRRQSIRHLVSVPGRYRMGRGIAKDVNVIDISESGARFIDRFGTLKVNTEITVKVGTIGPIISIVRWTNQQQVGVEFANRIYGPVLEHIKEKLSANQEFF